MWEVKKTDKIPVTCQHCGHKFETQTPFPTTMCPECHKKTEVKKPA